MEHLLISKDRTERIRSFSLPKLPYDYGALAPHISEEQLKLHHDKHHQHMLMAPMQALKNLIKPAKGKCRHRHESYP